LQGDSIVLQPHSLSPVTARLLRHPKDAEVIGQVIGIALKLGDWRGGNNAPDQPPRRAPSKKLKRSLPPPPPAEGPSFEREALPDTDASAFLSQYRPAPHPHVTPAMKCAVS